MTQSLLAHALNQFASKSPLPKNDLFEPQFIDIGEHRIRYFRREKPDAPSLLLLNGLPQSIRMWESSLAALSDHFDILAIDIPGFGLSTTSSANMTPMLLSKAIIDCMDHFEIERAHLVGPDVGVPIALTATINHPERFESLNIFDGPGTYPPKMSPILLAIIKSRLVRTLAKTVLKKQVMKTNFLTAVKEGYSNYQPNERAIREYYTLTHDPKAHECAIEFFGSYQTALPWIEERLSTMQIPTLITWGELDPFVLVNNAHELHRKLPNSEIEILKGASHFSAEDANERYVELLINWVNKHSTSQQPKLSPLKSAV